jgi:predicted CXXCH cytochrome family protein
MKRPVLSVLFFSSLLLLALIVGEGGEGWADHWSVDHSGYSADAYELCMGCHPRALPTHKRNKTKNVPAGWPVGLDGRLVCLTCHDCTSGHCILRDSSDRICRNCHDCTQGMACVLGVAHMGTSPRIDLHIRDCLACHDGRTATEAAGPGQHRVDVLYIEGREFNRVTDRRIVFVDGKVTCLSCHDPYKDDKQRVTASIEGSRLCLICHIK